MTNKPPVITEYQHRLLDQVNVLYDEFYNEHGTIPSLDEYKDMVNKAENLLKDK